MAIKLGIQTYQILTDDDEVCIPNLSSILLAVRLVSCFKECARLCVSGAPVGMWTRPHQVLASTLTLSQPGGQIMTTLY